MTLIDTRPQPSTAPLHPTFDFDVAIVGMGYVGLPTALTWHAAGAKVLGYDVSHQRMDAIRSMRVDLLPSDLVRLATALPDERFSTSTSPAELSRAACVIICVPTPVDAHLVPDLRILRAACEQVVACTRRGQVVILTSTTYVGCTRDLLVEPLASRGMRTGEDVFVAFSPERIDPGNGSQAHENVPRVLGGVTSECGRRAKQLIGTAVREVWQVSSPEAAELTKLLENTFRAVNIAMVNEFAEASAVLGLDVMEVIRAARTKPYGYMSFTPGAGVGGHCIPCDPHYLLWQLRSTPVAMPLVEQAMRGIALRPHRAVERAREVLCATGRTLYGANILILGMAYKPNVEDLRESPALSIASGLRRAGARVSYHDPFIPEVTLPDGTRLSHQPEPDVAATDLVLVHTWHAVTDHRLVQQAPLVLDATYNIASAPNVTQL